MDKEKQIEMTNKLTELNELHDVETTNGEKKNIDSCDKFTMEEWYETYGKTYKEMMDKEKIKLKNIIIGELKNVKALRDTK